MSELQEQLDNPDAHTCTTCGQGLGGTDHLKKIIVNLQKQIAQVEKDVEKTIADADICNVEATAIDEEIVQTKENHEIKKTEAKNKIEVIKKDITIARENIEKQQKEAAEYLVISRDEEASLIETKNAFDVDHKKARDELTALGTQPKSRYANRDAVWKLRQDRELLLNQIESELAKPNPNESKIDGLKSTLAVVDYESVNECNIRLKHEMFLYKLLTAKDSFVRKKLIDQNLVYLNKRMNHYLERLGLPHEVKFMPDLTVEVTLLGKELDFEQLSRGEMNRVILATCWSFRDVWESLNTSFNLFFLDEIVDFGMDDQGAEAALAVLQTMACDRHKNVFLISH